MHESTTECVDLPIGGQLVFEDGFGDDSLEYVRVKRIGRDSFKVCHIRSVVFSQVKPPTLTKRNQKT